MQFRCCWWSGLVVVAVELIWSFSIIHLHLQERGVWKTQQFITRIGYVWMGLSSESDNKKRHLLIYIYICPNMRRMISRPLSKQKYYGIFKGLKGYFIWIVNKCDLWKNRGHTLKLRLIYVLNRLWWALVYNERYTMLTDQSWIRLSVKPKR